MKHENIPITPVNTATTGVAEQHEYSHGIRLAACIVGIMTFFLLYGIFQERVMWTAYGKTTAGEDIYFEDTTFVVFANRILGVVISGVAVLMKGGSFKNVAPLYKYAMVAASNFASTWFQYEALKYMSFPTQTLGKCGKMFPVMIVGAVVGGKRYTLRDYLIATFVTAGCMTFLTGHITAKAAVDPETDSIRYGLLLVLGYLFFDSFTSTFQEKMFKGYTMSPNDQMIHNNLWASLICVAIMVWNNSVRSTVSFGMAHPAVIGDILFLSICSACGQLIIYYVIKEFGALMFSTIMVTRHFFSIVLSCIIFVHPLTPSQWMGFLMVFGALYAKAIQDLGRKRLKPTTT